MFENSKVSVDSYSTSIEDRKKKCITLKDTENSLIEKEKGNNHFKNKNYSKSLSCYSRAIQHDPYNPILYLNRSQSFIHLKQYSEAITDATACLKLDKGNIKALLRRGIARREMGYTKESQSDFELGLVLDPLNSVLKRELEALKKWIKEKDEKKNANKIDNKSDVSDVIKKGDITLGLKKRLHIEEIGVPSDYLSLNKKSSVSNLDEQLLVKKAQKTRSIEVLDSNAIQIQQTNNVKEMESDFNTVIQSSSGIIIPINNQPSMSKVSKSASELEFKMKLSQKYASARKKLPTQIPATMYEFMRDWKRLSDPKDQFDYIRMIPCDEFCKILKYGLESDLLSKMLLLFTTFYLKFGMEKECFELLSGLKSVDRFDMTLMFLSRKERIAIDCIFERLVESGIECCLLAKSYGVTL